MIPCRYSGGGIRPLKLLFGRSVRFMFLKGRGCVGAFDLGSSRLALDVLLKPESALFDILCRLITTGRAVALRGAAPTVLKKCDWIPHNFD